MGILGKKSSKKKTGYRTAARKSFHLENLELRQLLATVNVADFGATINDGTNDLGAIQRAISASKAGDTVLFSGGRFNLSDEITLPGDRTYLGQNGATLSGKGAAGHLLKVQSNNVTIRGLTIDGGGVFVEKPGGGRNSNIVIDANRFQLNTTGSHRSAITFTSGLNSSTITNNYFTGYNGSFGIYGYNYSGLTIANNEFVNISAGMHIDAFGNCGNLLVEQNFISGTKGMGMEFQGTANGLVFQDNWYESPSFVSLPGTAGGNTMGYSLILDKSSNITIQRNTMIAPKKGSGGDYVRINFEVGGDNTLVTDNFTSGGNHVVAMNDGVGTASVTVKNNRFVDYAQGISNSFASAIRTLVQTNNGANTRLSDTMESRLSANQKPGIGSKRYGSSPPPVVEGNPNPTPTPIPTPTPTPAPTPIPLESGVSYLSDLTYNRAVNGWGLVELNKSVGERATGDGKTMTVANRSYSKGLGVHSHSEITYVLNGAYTTFQSDIGIDAEVGARGSVVFEVWADGALLYSSGIMTGASGFKQVNVDVTGKQQLVLIVTNGGDNNNFDHADWANARLTPTPPPPPVTEPVDPTPEPEPEPEPVPGEEPGTDTGGGVRAPTRLPLVSYLSDLTWTSATNGWGPVELDMSNGQKPVRDGKILTIDGKTYDSGLGVHADSSVNYSLNGNYSTFSADIGIDDETNGRGSVVFEVWADGYIIFTSGVMTAADGYRSINVDVSGKQTLSLVVTNAGDGMNYDHANWADARLTAVSDGTQISQVPFAVITNGWGPAEVNQSNGERLAADGSLMSLNGVVYGTGLGVHAPSEVVVTLNGQYDRFVSDIGIDDEVGVRGSVVFQVYADGELVFESDVMTGSTDTEKVDVDVTGKQQLVLKVVSPDAVNYDHANWAGAVVVADQSA